MFHSCSLEEKFEDVKGIIRNRKSKKDMNGQKKKVNNDQQNTTRKIND